MLSGRPFLAAISTLIIAALQSPVHGQYYGGDACCGAVAAAPVSCCTPIQPVQTTCYQTIPVTTYTRERQTVEVPTYETVQEEREVTYYRPVTISREIDQPYTTYQNVTEYQTVNRDMGRWVTQYHPVARCAPCQVDPRPGVIGWMNRTGYSMRTAFMPSYTTSRHYVPNMVSCQVPYTRQVAVQATRRVTVQETRMVAERRTEKYPVQKLVMKKEEITVMKPQTAYRTVPIGTAMAYGPYVGGSQMAFGYPVIDNTTRAAQAEPDPISERAAFKEDSSSSDGNFRREADSSDSRGVRGSSYENDKPLRSDDEPEIQTFGPNTNRGAAGSITPPAGRRDQNSLAAVSKASRSTGSGWRATRKPAERQLTQIQTRDSKVSVAGTSDRD
jgi:hypothetical protein